ncbi:MAG: ASKHA domain-containing protein, partial [Thermodesulfobacteriota bacterium]
MNNRDDVKKKFVVIFKPSGRRGLIQKERSIREASIEIGENIEGPCGGKGTCGKCKVKIEDGFFEKYGINSSIKSLSPISSAEKEFLSHEDEKNGFRLACQARIFGDIVVWIPEESRLRRQVIRKAIREINIKINPAVKKYFFELPKAGLNDLRGDWERIQDEFKRKYGLVGIGIDYQVLKDLQKIIREGNWSITVSLWNDQEVIKVEPGYIDKAYGMAIDIGTTTLAGYLCDLSDGRVVATSSMMNPQVVFGEDIMSRINYAIKEPHGLERLNQAIMDGINGMIEEATSIAGLNPMDIIDMTAVGNTCMHHIFLHLDPRNIGRSPFTPAIKCSMNIKAREIGFKNSLRISPGAYVHVLPIEAGFVGADNVGVIISEEPYNQDQVVLIIDIGTNGELVLGNRKRLISCSCATGPAFEGAHI